MPVMSDRESRTRQREAESEDERVAALRSRLRSGAVSPEALALSAALGHGPAVSALGSAAPAGDHLPWGVWSQLLRREDWLALHATVAQGVKRALEGGMEELQRLRAEAIEETAPDPEELERIARLEADGEEMLASQARLIAWDGQGEAPRAEKPGCGEGLFWLLRTTEWTALRVSSSWPALTRSRDRLSPQDFETLGHTLAHLAERADREAARLLVPRLLGETLALTTLAASPVDYLEHRRTAGEVSQAALEVAAAAGHEAASELTGMAPAEPFPVWLSALKDLPFDTIRGLALSIALDTSLHYLIGLRSPETAAGSVLERLESDWIHRLRITFLPPPTPDDEWHETWREDRPDQVREVAAWLESQAEAAREAQNHQLDSYATNWALLVEHVDEESAAVVITGITRLWQGLDPEFRGQVEERLRGEVIHDALKPKALPKSD